MENESSELESLLNALGLTAEKFENVYDIPTSKIRHGRENPDGAITLLCADETKEGTSYYVVRISKRTKDWNEAKKIYDK